ncbi:MAG TPA: prepilin-type N-terminal cleavage/methylation domain-containing protein [bacterium]|nr:prepilin-type N-terminal cleavage/methylation domain-containing protein [bacterium]
MIRRARGTGRPGEAGMTILELMVVMIILSIALDAMFSLLLASYKAYWKGDVATQVQQGGRIALTRMIRDVRAGRRLVTGVTRTVGSTSVNFNTSCTQVSTVQPHLGNITLSDGSSIYAPDANATGTIPYDGYDVTYYLAATNNSTTPNTSGPYLIRASYDIVANTITVSNVAANITSLNLSSGGSCITTASREFTMLVTASQTQTGQGVSSQIVIKDDVTLRNQ